MNFARIIIIMTCLLMMISGCTPAAGERGEKQEITLWYWNRSLDEDILAQVEEVFPNVELDTQKIGGDFRLKLQTTLVGRSGGPDIIAFNDWISQYLPYEEYFVNLYDYGAKDVEEQYLEWKWKLAETQDGEKLIALPLDTGPTGLFYRVDLFEQAGLPTDPDEVAEQLSTWDAYIEAGKQLQEETGVHMFDSALQVFRAQLSQSPMKHFTSENEYIGDEAHMKEMWDRAVSVAEQGLTFGEVSGTDWNAGLNNGQIASFVSAVWQKKILEDAAPDTSGKWRIARSPGGDGNQGGSFLGVMNSSEHKELSYQIIEWLMSPENQTTAYKTYDLFPAAKSSLESGELSSEEAFFGGQDTSEVFVESAKNVPETYLSEYKQLVNSIFEQELQLVEKRGKDPEQAWNDVQKAISRELSRR
ncbi:ABC transporter substrate-binding protein [Litoribacterium kuwaitense]|uniref:ABC transporter substrate-binding protein n=1 Tax=Litoribacterium kuwaitense TaxID=1398745 RepID=UPI0028AB2EE0|nr:extracellular solute-binding protein [Litoribacterium kuwaitense]